MKSFYFIRHAESEANKAGIMCGGGVDTPLSPEGIKQAEQAKDILDKINLPIAPDIVAHSAMARTQKTAEIINIALRLPFHQETRIKEHVVGLWEGKAWAEIEHDFITRVDPPEGETHQFFSARVKAGFNDILCAFKAPFIVAHGGVWIALMKLFDPESLFLMENAVPHYCEYDPKKTGFPWHVYRMTMDGLMRVRDI